MAVNFRIEFSSRDEAILGAFGIEVGKVMLVWFNQEAKKWTLSTWSSHDEKLSGGMFLMIRPLVQEPVKEWLEPSKTQK